MNCYIRVVFGGVFNFASGVTGREEVHGAVLGAHRFETIRLTVAILVAFKTEHGVPVAIINPKKKMK